MKINSAWARQASSNVALSGLKCGFGVKYASRLAEAQGTVPSSSKAKGAFILVGCGPRKSRLA